MSSKLKSVTLVAAGTLCGVGGIKACAYLEQRSPRSTIESREGRFEPSTPPAQHRREGLTAPPAAIAPAPRPTPPEGAARAPDDATEPSPPGRTDEEVHFQVEQRFQREPPASPAALVFSRTVEGAFAAKAAAGAHVQKVQCRDVLCQVALRFDNSDSERSVMSDVLLYGPLRKYASLASARAEEGDTIHVTLYVAREGELTTE